MEKLGNRRYLIKFKEVDGVFRAHCQNLRIKNEHLFDQSIQRGEEVPVLVVTGPFCMQKRELMNCTIYDVPTSEKDMSVKKKRFRDTLSVLGAKLLLHV